MMFIIWNDNALLSLLCLKNSVEKILREKMFLMKKNIPCKLTLLATKILKKIFIRKNYQKFIH